MTIKHFIEKAIEGGWTRRSWYDFKRVFPNGWCDLKLSYGDGFDLQRARNDGTPGRWVRMGHVHPTLLDPEAWKAVGKVEGWVGCPSWAEPWSDCGTGRCDCKGWLKKMHRMVDALAEGKSVEEYLETL